MEELLPVRRARHGGLGFPWAHAAGGGRLERLVKGTLLVGFGSRGDVTRGGFFLGHVLVVGVGVVTGDSGIGGSGRESCKWTGGRSALR